MKTFCTEHLAAQVFHTDNPEGQRMHVVTVLFSGEPVTFCAHHVPEIKELLTQVEEFLAECVAEKRG